MLVSLVWAALFFMAGLHWFWVLGLGGVGAFGGFAAFKLSPHVHERVLRFIDPDSRRRRRRHLPGRHRAAEHSVGRLVRARARAKGVYKRILPDAHTDFVFAVTGEEFGMIACLALIAFFGFIVMRGLWLASRNEDPFCRLAAAGLTLMFGVQSWINMAVNLRAIPAKGMTLPFISYGGSSLLALGLGMGFLDRADAQAAARRFRRQAGGHAVSEAALHPRRRGRHGRTPFSRLRAGGGAQCARRAGRTRRRRARAASTAAIFPPARSTSFPRRRRPRRAPSPRRARRRCSRGGVALALALFSG